MTAKREKLYLYLLRVLLDEDIGVLLRRVLAAGRVVCGHEIVVEVVVAAHTDGEYALAEIVGCRAFISQYVHYLLHYRPVVLQLPIEADSPTLKRKKQ